jgi:hypothetical protein
LSQKGVLRFYNYDTKNNFTSSGDRNIFFIAPTQSNNLRQGRGDRSKKNVQIDSGQALSGYAAAKSNARSAFLHQKIFHKC